MIAKTQKSKRNIVVGYTLSLIILTGTSLLSYVAVEKLLDTTHWVDHTNLVMIKLEDVISAMKDAETGQRGYLLTNDPEFLEPYTGAKERARAAFDTVRYLTADNKTQQLASDTLEMLMGSKNTILATMIAAKQAGSALSLDSLKSGKATMDKMRSVVKRMQQREINLLAGRTASMEKYAAYSPVIIVIASLLAIGLTILFYFRIRKDHEERILMEQELIRKEEETAQKIAVIERMAGQVADGNYGLRIGEEGAVNREVKRV